MNINPSITAIRKVIAQFAIKGDISEIKPFGSGHINDTYHIKNTDEAEHDYLLQRINHSIFKDVPALIENLKLVTTHLHKKLAAIPGSDPEKEAITLIPTKKQQYFFKDEYDNFWRLYYFLKDTKSYDIVETEKQASEGGKAFGRFQNNVADLDVNLIAEVLPDFHNIAHRLNQFNTALTADVVNRATSVSYEINFLQQRAYRMSTILQWGKEGKLPVRITHNDTKFNNVLLNKNDEAQCVIDLDTVMPGYIAYDFGDAIRSIINTGAEDEKDLEKIQLNMPLFDAFAKAFIKETGHFLTPFEIKSLGEGVLLLPYIMGVRFLTDYLAGDTYYKIHFAGQNIQRARAQFQLVKKLEEQFDVLSKTITDATSGLL